jgi:cyclopropane-fatty-acyl-phospholipid synthase
MAIHFEKGLVRARRRLPRTSWTPRQRTAARRNGQAKTALSGKTSAAQLVLADFLALADVEINGQRPWDLQIHDDRTFARVVSQGSFGLGESYVDGWWDCEDLPEFFNRILRAGLDERGIGGKGKWKQDLKARIFNLQSRSRARKVGKVHYDKGNDLFEQMLDKRMTYSCGYWNIATTLEKAQEDKLDLICRKLHLKPGQRILDIGCGWGSFARWAAERYGVDVVGVTVSREQFALANELCRGLPIEIRLQDYRDLDEQFDHIVSIGMFEHVGHKNHATYMDVTHRCLKDSGINFVHTCGNHVRMTTPDPFIAKYIFPNSIAPSPVQIARSIEGRFQIEDWHNFPAHPHYTNTLLAWYGNFKRNWPNLEGRYGSRFFRMWEYYLLAAAGCTKSQTIGLWQIALSKSGIDGGYKSIR